MTKRLTTWAVVGLLGCLGTGACTTSSEAEGSADAPRDAGSDGAPGARPGSGDAAADSTAGAVGALPATLQPSDRLSELDSDAQADFCAWVSSLEQPDCPGLVEPAKIWLLNFCSSLDPALEYDCEVTVADGQECATQVLSCVEVGAVNESCRAINDCFYEAPT